MPVDMLTIGDHAQFRGPRVQDFLQTMWWKVTAISDDGRIAHLVNRHGNTARVRRTERYQHLRALRWEPGDPHGRRLTGKRIQRKSSTKEEK
jgi:hypothetical protein